jgi:hypothetical protein
MHNMLKLSALVAIVLTSGCVAVGPGQPRYSYGGGPYYGGVSVYVPPPVRVYSPVFYSPPPPTRVIVVRDQPYRSKPYRRWHGQGNHGR